MPELKSLHRVVVTAEQFTLSPAFDITSGEVVFSGNKHSQQYCWLHL